MISFLPQSRPLSRALPRCVGWLAGGLAIIVGGLVLAGWIFDVPALRSGLPGWVAIKPNTALAFILIGFAMLVRGPHAAHPSPVARVLSCVGGFGALLAGLIGFLTVGEYLFEWNSGLDRLLFVEPAGAIATSHPGRMAPESALCFGLLAVAMWGLGQARAKCSCSVAAALAGALVAILALASLLTYFTPALGAFGWFGLTRMAVPTAVTFAVLGAAVVANVYRQDAFAWALNRSSMALFASGMLLLVLIGLNAARSQSQVHVTSQWLTHQEELLDGTALILAEVTLVQNHSRGFLLTANERFLRSHAASIASSAAALSAQRQRIGGDSAERRRFDTLAADTAEVLQWFQRMLDASRVGLTDAARLEFVRHGEDLMDRLRATFAQSVSEQRKVSAQAKQTAANAARFSFAILAAGTFTSLGMFLTVLLGLNRVAGARGRAEAAVREANLQLENRVAELRDSEQRFICQRDALISLSGADGPFHDLDAALRRITETSARVLGAARVSLWRFNADRSAIHCVDLYELEADRHTSGLELSAADYPAYFRSLEQMEVLEVEDPERDPRTCEFADSYLRPLGITSMLDAGIRMHGRVEGVLCHEQTGTPRAWKAGEHSFVAALANLASLEIVEAQRFATENSLREHADIIAHAHEGVVIVNFANKITLWNIGAERIFGLPATEAIGRPPEDVMGVSEPGAVAALRAAVERDEHWSGDLRAHARDGRDLIVECHTTLVRDANGRPRARLTFIADVTEKKLLEEKFLHAQRLESIGMLAAGIAHDLNNVLAPVVFAAPMLRPSLSAERDLKVLSTLERSAERGASLVKQILGFAHARTGEFHATQIKHIARDIVDIAERTFPKSIQIEHRIPADLWPVWGNATHIHQVLLNLFVNARDAMPDGGTLRLTAANRRLDAVQASLLPGGQPGAWLLLEVSDTGTGIPPELLARIWDPFFTTKGAGKGTGLGLSTVRGIVVTHGGFVTLDTAPGRGATFRVFLPVAQEAAPAPVTATPKEFTGHGELVLIVDDDLPFRDTLAALLQTHGYGVITASNGQEAFSQFRQHTGALALVVTDIDMPFLNGAALCGVLAKVRPELPVLQMSGFAPSAEASEAVASTETSPRLFLQKPFSPDALLEAVDRLLPIGILA
jgi:PAS domain S-box-containing protein